MDVSGQFNHKFDLVFTIDPVTTLRNVPDPAKYGANQFANQWINWWEQTEKIAILRGNEVNGAQNTQVRAQDFKAARLDPRDGHIVLPLYEPMLNSLYLAIYNVAEQVNQLNSRVGMALA